MSPAPAPANLSVESVMFDQWTLKKKLVATFAAILALAGVLIGVALVNTSRLLETVGWNTHTYQVLAESERMLLNMVNIETGLRGFVASGDEKFLDPLKQGREKFAEHFDKAKSLTSDNAEQQARTANGAPPQRGKHLAAEDVGQAARSHRHRPVQA